MLASQNVRVLLVLIVWIASTASSRPVGSISPLTPQTRNATRNSAGFRARTMSSSVSVDMRNYMSASIANANGTGEMLCASNNLSNCITSFYDGGPKGETKIVYSNGDGVIDYIGITTGTEDLGQGPEEYIGVIRNLTGTGGQLRCFTYINTTCTAPALHVNIPQGVPYLISSLPVISAAMEQSTENPDGSPESPLPGALLTTPNSSNPPGYTFFADVNMSSSCAQSLAFNTNTSVHVVYVTGMAFGGSIGTQDGVVINTYTTGPPRHFERFYYVKGLGRVRESVSFYNPNTGLFNANTTNSVHNTLETLNVQMFNDFNAGGCPQGSAVPLY